MERDKTKNSCTKERDNQSGGKTNKQTNNWQNGKECLKTIYLIRG